jgi:hypothetical protein
MDFSSLKARAQNIGQLQQQAQALNKRQEFEDNDDTFWAPQRGKDGNGIATIRFLPAPFVDGDDAQPFVKYFRHSFQSPTSGDWYIENCLTTLGRKDPVNDLTRILYKAETKHDEDLAGKYKRKVTFVTNILVIDDQIKPENNGKVKKYRFGIKIWEKIEAAMNPKVGKAINPFSFWDDGANFYVITKTVKDFANYDDSKFDMPAALPGDDAYLESLWKQSYSLKAFLEEKNFKEYDVLKKKLDEVLAFTYEDRGAAMNAGKPEFVSPMTRPTSMPASSPAVLQPAPVAPAEPASTWVPTAPTTAPVAPVAAQDDAELAFLKQMANKA